MNLAKLGYDVPRECERAFLNLSLSTCHSQLVSRNGCFQRLSLNQFGDEMCAKPSLRAQRSNPDSLCTGILDCFAALAMTEERGAVPLDDDLSGATPCPTSSPAHRRPRCGCRRRRTAS